MSYMNVEDHAEAGKKPRKKLSRFSKQCFCTGFIFAFIFLGIISLMIVIPVVQHINKVVADNKDAPSKGKPKTREDIMIEATKGPIPVKKKLVLIDPDTPDDKKTIISSTNEEWKLAFSDEFNESGRTFYPGDDPVWEAVDLWYEGTQDAEYYKPDYASTEQGYLVITAEDKPVGDLKYSSAMLQSWNKLCFKGGRIEMSVSLPGDPHTSGFWPGAWMLGNLGRAGYKSTTDGLWPYSYDTCDQGVKPDQGDKTISGLIGQKLNKCVCDGEDHPSPGTGRGAPEIDIIEALSSHSKGGEVSQSFQLAPFDKGRTVNPAGTQFFPDFKTTLNTYNGGPLQQAVSALSSLPSNIYSGTDFITFSVEYEPGDDGYITWLIDNKPTWTIKASAIAANKDSKVDKRLIPEEPMYLILNLALSEDFSKISSDLKFPGHFLIDYVRIYQHPDRISITCDPPNYPTTDYIDKHRNAYYNKNWTTWELAGYKKPSYDLEKCKKS